MCLVICRAHRGDENCLSIFDLKTWMENHPRDLDVDGFHKMLAVSWLPERFASFSRSRRYMSHLSFHSFIGVWRETPPCSSNHSDARLSFLNKLMSSVLIMVPLGNAHRGRDCLVWKGAPGPTGSFHFYSEQYVSCVTLNIICEIQIIQQRMQGRSSCEIFIHLKREKTLSFSLLLSASVHFSIHFCFFCSI
jgi:hypothetical protein